ncbi:hypothetical protein JTB14_007677 [Gonioctena quinquepunctata]|nr:hypothetical protein JTB14_007677 [Gonioctena quinquepunctata]
MLRAHNALGFLTSLKVNILQFHIYYFPENLGAVSEEQATQEAIKLNQFGKEFWPNLSKPPVLIYSDNKSAINLATSDDYRARTKHIDIRHHFVRQKLEDGYIHIQHVGTEEMIADILTKAIFKSKHEVFTKNMNTDV